MELIEKNPKQRIEDLILSLLAAPSIEMTRTEIAKKINRDSSNIGKKLGKMLSCGLIEHNKTTKRYKITSGGIGERSIAKKTRRYKAFHRKTIKDDVKTGTDPEITKIINDLFNMSLEELKQSRLMKKSGGRFFYSIFLDL